MCACVYASEYGLTYIQSVKTVNRILCMDYIVNK